MKAVHPRHEGRFRSHTGENIERSWKNASMCVCELQTALGIAQSTTSKHLKILEDAGLVGFRTRRALGQLHDWPMVSQSPFAASLLGNLRHWLNDEPEISAADGLDQTASTGSRF
jgi:hypothetical protein